MLMVVVVLMPMVMSLIVAVPGLVVFVRIARVHNNVDLGSGEAAASDLAHFQTRADVQGCGSLFKQGERHARVDQSAEQHVSTDAGKAVEVGNSHQRKL
jgi:hypothetical protein